jgi:hypothetical protein
VVLDGLIHVFVVPVVADAEDEGKVGDSGLGLGRGWGGEGRGRGRVVQI